MKKLTTTLTIMLGAVLAARFASGQSLGDIAKKAQADKAKRTQPVEKKVYTDKDLGTPAPLPEPAVAPPPAAKADVTPPPTSAQHDEAYWRGRYAASVDQLLADRRLADAAAARLLALPRLEANMASLAVFGPETVRLTTGLRDANAVVANDLATIEALREEGRRAGALPGWFR